MVAHPADDVLRQLGRVAVATAAVDHALFRLRTTLDRTAVDGRARGDRARAGKGTRTRVRKLACERLTGQLLDEVLQGVETAEALLEREHRSRYRYWALGEEPPAGGAGGGSHPGPERWQRAPDELSRWRPSRGGAPVDAAPRGPEDDLEPLGRLHDELIALVRRLEDLTCGVARARDLGDPPEWDGPAPRGRRLTATYSTQGGAPGSTGGAGGGAGALVLTSPETGLRHGRVALHDGGEDAGGSGGEDPAHPGAPARPGSGAVDRHAGPGWYRLLPWAGQLGALPMSTEVLDRALERSGWHRVMPWVEGRDGASTSTTVERIGRGALQRARLARWS